MYALYAVNRFGGDVNNISAVGASAGAYNIMALMVSSLETKGIFHKAIIMVGVLNDSACKPAPMLTPLRVLQ